MHSSSVGFFQFLFFFIIIILFCFVFSIGGKELQQLVTNQFFSILDSVEEKSQKKSKKKIKKNK